MKTGFRFFLGLLIVTLFRWLNFLVSLSGDKPPEDENMSSDHQNGESKCGQEDRIHVNPVLPQGGPVGNP